MAYKLLYHCETCWYDAFISMSDQGTCPECGGKMLKGPHPEHGEPIWDTDEKECNGDDPSKWL